MATKPAQSAHPRRPPANASVSLVHKPSNLNPAAAAAAAAARSSRRQPTPPELAGKRKRSSDDSGESSDAGKWFDNANNNVGNGDASTAPAGSPFFFRNSSSDQSPEGSDDKLRDAGDSSLPRGQLYHGVLDTVPQLSTANSSNDFRSVIDDLTVQNQKLKQRLKKFEKLHDTHLQDEKLFELRVHGLSASKKRELEVLLRKFSTGLDDGQVASASTTRTSKKNESSNTSSSQTRNLSSGAGINHSSSHVSTRPSDSAYVSMDSNQTSSKSPSKLSMGNLTQQPKAAPGQRSRMVQSYLHDQYHGLLFNQAASLPDGAKRQLVVDRLEQLFSGRGAADGGHQQPEQQEEVAQTAAKDDRMESERTGQSVQAEGLRQARIMPKQLAGATPSGADKLDLNIENFDSLQVPTSTAVDTRASDRSPDQRPTRPLDLDICRAQVPQENMEYIRHLGFSPPTLGDGALGKTDDKHGWIYLNLLMNMAQLHTINVTTSFVRDALVNHSKKFELSSNGRKIRWLGDNYAARDSSDMSLGGAASSSNNADSDSLMKRNQSFGQGASEPSAGMSHPSNNVSHSSGQPKDPFAYTPLFKHRESSEDDDYTSSGFGPSYPSDGNVVNAPAGSSHLDGSGHATGMSKKRLDDGPIIFYSKAKFCTDLSGDSRGANAAMNKINYVALGNRPMGGQQAGLGGPDSSDGDSQSPLKQTVILSDGDKMDMDSASASSGSGNLHFPPASPALTRNNSEEFVSLNHDLVDFEASGLGNVQPDDNFEINVKSRQLQANPDQSNFAGAGHHRPNNVSAYGRDIRDALEAPMGLVLPGVNSTAQHPSAAGAPLYKNKRRRRRQQQPAIRQQILSSTHRTLPASELPPASYFHCDTPEDSDSDVGSNTETGDDRSHATTSRVAGGFSPNKRRALGPSLRMRSRSPGPYGTHYQPGSRFYPQAPGIAQADFASGVAVAGGDSDDGHVTNAGEESESDGSGSVDMLAAARELDPDTIMKREREYDAELAERLAEEIPAGSSAATAGGGSGFNSPYTGPGQVRASKRAAAVASEHASDDDDDDDGDDDDSDDAESGSIRS